MQWLFPAGRILLGLTFILDAGWNIATYDLRAAYLDLVGAPHFLTILTAVVFAICGAALIANYKIRITPYPLAAILILMSLVLLTDVNGKGIGEYPAEFQIEVLFKEWLVHLTIVAALVFLANQSLPEGGASPMREMTMAGRAGRAMIGGYFIINALWQWYYIDIRIEHIVASGGTGTSLPYIIGFQIIFGLLVAAGIALKYSAPPLMLIITVSTIVVHGNISETSPYPANLQIHQWFVKSAVLAGLVLVLGQDLARARPAAEKGNRLHPA
ncbi:MAG: hypothetical protein HXY22_03405 [Alphaproteobacteria bacterium]|nr:hypothetical protein [Alphaproteobacteria bacterium]